MSNIFKVVFLPGDLIKNNAGLSSSDFFQEGIADEFILKKEKELNSMFIGTVSVHSGDALLFRKNKEENDK